MDVLAPNFDPFEQYFVDYVKTSAKGKSVAILGIAYYGRVIDSVFRDTNVGKLYIVDLLKDKLSAIKESLRDPDYPRCILIPSNAVDLNFSPCQFQAILASGWLNSLPHNQVSKFIEQCFEWLEPGGQLFVSVACHHEAHIGLHLIEDMGDLDSDKDSDVQGNDFHDGSRENGDQEHSINGNGMKENHADVNDSRIKSINGNGMKDTHADVNDLSSELSKAGFTIDKCGHISGHIHPEHWQHFGQRHVVAVGRKPLAASDGDAN